MLVPGEAVLLTAGYLAGRGLLSPCGAWLVAWAGAVVGDQVSFLLGRRLGQRLLRGRAELRHRLRHALQAERRWLVLSYHYVAWLRTWLPVIAGSIGLPFRQWCLLDAVGVMLWITPMFAAGYALQAGLRAETPALRGGLAISLVVLMTMVWRVGRRLRRASLLPPDEPGKPAAV